MTAASEHVVVGLSGGVDSSLSAALLKRAGYRVSALFMKNWDEDDEDGCAAAEDLADAEAVASQLSIELRTVNFATEYWDRVFQQFLAEHRAGRTPNPDVLCNREIKFREFIEHAVTLGADAVATGHYARCEQRDGRFRLLRGVDENKDQSYFLHALGQEALAKARFPLGWMAKADVRAQAQALSLPTHDKRDSTGICFIGERHFQTFLARYIETDPGRMETPDGNCVGTHRGLAFYTLGQRQGLGIGGRQGRTGAPWYVYGKDLERNVLGVVQGHDHPLLFSRALEARDFNWISGTSPKAPFNASVKTRYRQRDVPCRVVPLGADVVRIELEYPERAVTPGQSAVIYAADECLGGGVISGTEPLAAAA